MVEVFDSLYLQLSKHSFIEEKDKKVIKRIIYLLKESPEDLLAINDLLNKQTELEMSCLYLITMYQPLLVYAEEDCRKIESTYTLTIPPKTKDGYRRTVTEYKAKVDTNVDIENSRKEYNRIKLFFDALKGLSKIVHDKNRRLEQLSVNYRKEEF